MLHLLATFLLAYALTHMSHHLVWAMRFPGTEITRAERMERYRDSRLLATAVTFFVGTM